MVQICGAVVLAVAIPSLVYALLTVFKVRKGLDRGPY